MSALHVRVFAREGGGPRLTLQRSRSQHRSPQGSSGAFLKRTGHARNHWRKERTALDHTPKGVRGDGMWRSTFSALKLPWADDLTYLFWLVTESNRLGGRSQE